MQPSSLVSQRPFFMHYPMRYAKAVINFSANRLYSLAIRSLNFLKFSWHLVGGIVRLLLIPLKRSTREAAQYRFRMSIETGHILLSWNAPRLHHLRYLLNQARKAPTADNLLWVNIRSNSLYFPSWYLQEAARLSNSTTSTAPTHPIDTDTEIAIAVAATTA